jgi:hypothetical protein
MMFSDLENEIRTYLDGTITGVPVLGTWDYVNLTEDVTARISMHVQYQGYDALQNRPGALTIGQQFAVHIIVDGATVLESERAAAETAVQTVIQRMLAWPGPLEVTMQSSPVVQMEGRALRMSVFFTVAPVVMTAD